MVTVILRIYNLLFFNAVQTQHERQCEYVAETTQCIQDKEKQVPPILYSSIREFYTLILYYTILEFDYIFIRVNWSQITA